MSSKVRYRDGESLLYLGQNYVLEIREYLSYKRPGVKLEREKLVVLTACKDSTVIETAIKQWYVKEAARVIQERIQYFQEQLQEPMGNVRIKDVKSRWGSCSSKRNLNFNWRLILLPIEILDYVVVHELCHLREMNHSKEFWKQVETILPDYKKRREWLKECRLIEEYL